MWNRNVVVLILGYEEQELPRTDQGERLATETEEQRQTTLTRLSAVEDWPLRPYQPKS